MSIEKSPSRCDDDSPMNMMFSDCASKQPSVILAAINHILHENGVILYGVYDQMVFRCYHFPIWTSAVIRVKKGIPFRHGVQASYGIHDLLLEPFRRFWIDPRQEKHMLCQHSTCFTGYSDPILTHFRSPVRPGSHLSLLDPVHPENNMSLRQADHAQCPKVFPSA